MNSRIDEKTVISRATTRKVSFVRCQKEKYLDEQPKGFDIMEFWIESDLCSDQHTWLE